MIKLPTKLLIIPGLFIAFSFCIFFKDVISNSFFRGEDGVIELLSAFFYLSAVFICIYGLIKKNKHAPYLTLWMVLTFIFFGEETSWLQHIIGYQTPDQILAVNDQKEFNLHNLKWFHRDSSLVEKIFSSQNLFRVGFFTYFLIIPIIGLCKLDRGVFTKFNFPLPGHKFMIFIWAPIFASLILTVFSTGPIKDVLAETREMFYAASIFTYVTLIVFLPQEVPVIKTAAFRHKDFSSSSSR